MFCKKCGFENSENTLYCINDGVSLKITKTIGSFKFDGSSFCKVCGKDNVNHSNYCHSCGNTFMKSSLTVSDHQLINSMKTETQSKVAFDLSFLNIDLIKKCLSGLVASLVIVFALSILFSVLISTTANEFLGEMIYSELGFPISMNEFKVVRFNDILLLSHMIGSAVSISALDSIDGSVSFKLGFYILLLIPFVALFIGGRIVGKKNRTNNVNENISLSVVFGVLYGLVLMILALLSRFEQNIPIFYGNAIGIRMSYSIFNSFINGFLLGSVFSYVGMIKKEHFNMHKVNIPVSCSIISVFKGLMISFIVLFIYLYNQMVEILNMNILAFGLFIMQVSAYFITLLSFGTIKITMREGGYGQDLIALNIYSKFDELKEVFYFSESFGFFVYLSLLIPITILILAGRKIRKSTNDEGMKNLVLFSLLYAVLIAIIGHLGSIKVVSTAVADIFSFALTLSVSIVPLFITTFIMAFIFSYIGFKTIKNH